MPGRHALTEADILPRAAYAPIRAARRREIAALKRNRRVEVGPFITFYFESYETMRHQVQEMCWIENGGPAQIPDELAAYNPLIPQGQELVATFMIEIDEPDRRRRLLGRLGGIEETAFLKVFGETIQGMPETDQDRTTAEGKASSVQFVHFPFTAAQIARFRTPGAEVVLGLGHPNYGHMAMLPEAVRAELSRDFD
ncbi:DUF3501 family protein [Siccirubricoccus sp. KC 17139]|uniref:DUF3501 family protein n=1 Tax=Siccirubricoccus soli TaxID=2899147 RepID=A0ABT1DBG2_9PROT|nr:DUF3501 family protein [Siccirubricoccus soli]MCO6418514.1 DUF3501 family protein [Siccirubricoccus soli]MCP2684649.1 DUF3501 family protein [Siccirubricoccus soli]